MGFFCSFASLLFFRLWIVQSQDTKKLLQNQKPFLLSTTFADGAAFTISCVILFSMLFFLWWSLFYADTSKYLITSQKLKVIFFPIQIVDSILCDSILLNPWAYICFSFRDPFKTFWVQFKFNGSSTMSSLQRSTIEVQVPFMLLTLVSKTQTFLPPKFFLLLLWLLLLFDFWKLLRSHLMLYFMLVVVLWSVSRNTKVRRLSMPFNVCSPHVQGFKLWSWFRRLRKP